MKKLSLITLATLVSLLVLSACSSPAAVNPPTTTAAPKTTAPAATTPATTAPKTTTPPATTAAPTTTVPPTTAPPTTAAVSAAPVYAASCAMCHGQNREGNPALKAPALNATTLAGKADADINATITNGKTGTMMTAYGSQISAAHISALVTFIKQP